MLFVFFEIYGSLLFFYWNTAIIFLQWNNFHWFAQHTYHLIPHIYLTSFSFILTCFTVPICPLINESSMLMFVVNITLALIFSSSNDARPPFSDCFRFCASLTLEILEFSGTSFLQVFWLAFLGSVSVDYHRAFWLGRFLQKYAKHCLDNVDDLCQGIVTWLGIFELENRVKRPRSRHFSS